MKKLVLLVSLLTISTAANAYPAPDMTEGGAPFLLLQQNAFEKTEMNDFRNFRDANDKPVSMRTDSAQQMKEEYKIKDRKRNPKFQLQSVMEQSQDVPQATEMQFIEKDGHIIIKSIDK